MNPIDPPSDFPPLVPGLACGKDCQHAREAGRPGTNPDWLWCERPAQSTRLRSLDPADDCLYFTPAPVISDASPVPLPPVS